MNRLNTYILTLCISCFSHSIYANTFKTEQWRTKNGVRVIFYQAKEVPMLDINLAFVAGSAYDRDNYGLSNFTTQMINEGSLGKTATTIAEELADTGSKINLENSRDMVVFSLRTLTSPEALSQSTRLFSDIISHPDFPEDSFTQEKKQILMAIAHSEESADNVAINTFFKNLYKDHPYGHSVNGTTSSVEAITRHQIVDFYHQYFIAENAVLVLVGAIDKQKAYQISELITQDLSRGTPASPIPEAEQINKSEQINSAFPSSQTIIRMGQIGIKHNNSQYFPLMVGNYILGGGTLVSRLGDEVREKRGLTYGISSLFTPMLGNGPFIISLSTKNEEAANALKITEDTLKLFIKNGPTPHELDAAKSYLTGSFPLSLGSNSAIASLLMRMAFYHLPDNYLDTYPAKINAVTINDIMRAFKEQVQTDKLLIVKVGQP